MNYKVFLAIALSFGLSATAHAKLSNADWVAITHELLDKCANYARKDRHSLEVIRVNRGSGIYDTAYLDFNAYYKGSCGIFGCNSAGDISFTLAVQAAPNGKYKKWLYAEEKSSDWCSDN